MKASPITSNKSKKIIASQFHKTLQWTAVDVVQRHTRTWLWYLSPYCVGPCCLQCSTKAPSLKQDIKSWFMGHLTLNKAYLQYLYTRAALTNAPSACSSLQVSGGVHKSLQHRNTKEMAFQAHTVVALQSVPFYRSSGTLFLLVQYNVSLHKAFRSSTQCSTVVWNVTCLI